MSPEKTHDSLREEILAEGRQEFENHLDSYYGDQTGRFSHGAKIGHVADAFIERVQKIHDSAYSAGIQKGLEMAKEKL